MIVFRILIVLAFGLPDKEGAVRYTNKSALSKFLQNVSRCPSLFLKMAWKITATAARRNVTG